MSSYTYISDFARNELRETIFFRCLQDISLRCFTEMGSRLCVEKIDAGVHKFKVHGFKVSFWFH